MSTKFNNEKPSQPLAEIIEMIDNMVLSVDGARSLVTGALELRQPLRSLNILEPLAVAKLALLIQRRKGAIFPDQPVPGESFGEVAWDMLLHLFVAQAENKRVNVSSLCIASGIPAATALRHVRHLVDHGLIDREADADDHRRVYLQLPDKTRTAIASILTGLGFP